MSIFHPLRKRRRKALNLMPFPPKWAQIIEKNVPCYQGLRAEERAHLEDLIKVFISEKNFEGCGGLVITDEIKVTVAALACLLLLNLNIDYYGQLVSVLVYPSGFNFKQVELHAIGTVSESDMPAAGLSSSKGVIVLSWPDTISGSLNPVDGVNVVFHEFAHQLDQLDGVMNGAPLLSSASLYSEWSKVLSAEYEQLREDVARQRESIIRAYGATRPAEFFAVVTEIFFEQPLQLKQDHPELYEEFSSYYRQDPAARLQSCDREKKL
ncbi:MAG: zinc-dependent peptidase [Kiritimatiellae bacterium]|nr:zinc-dependent peptidase [Kiritimatiellia bacterium]